MWRNLCLLWSLPLALFALAACTAAGEPAEGQDISVVDKGTSSGADSKSSSSKGPGGDSDSVFDMLEWVDIPNAYISRGGNDFGVNAFSIATTEVTQSLYKLVMDKLPKQSKAGDERAVSNVSWYRAALFCNAFSKRAGLDTAYVYKSVIGDSTLVDLTIDYSAKAVRLPTENEWEIAARGGKTTTYYWDTDVASKYAYYGQTTGPDVVAQKIPNDYGLYDVAGNVAEWVNDWYDTYPKNKSDNYTGPEKGTYRVIRGGGWSDKVTVLAPKEREKLSPVQSKETIGFRLVYSAGF